MVAESWSTWSRCIRSISAWCAPKRPSNARRSCGIFGRIRVCASSARASTSRTPAISASSICRAETPRMSETTESSLIPASSSSFCTRWVSRDRSSISFLR